MKTNCRRITDRLSELTVLWTAFFPFKNDSACLSGLAYNQHTHPRTHSMLKAEGSKKGIDFQDTRSRRTRSKCWRWKRWLLLMWTKQKTPDVPQAYWFFGISVRNSFESILLFKKSQFDLCLHSRKKTMRTMRSMKEVSSDVHLLKSTS